MLVTQPFPLREIDLPILTKSGNIGKGPTETANTLKRKLSKLKDPQDTEDRSLTEVLPKYSILPTFRQQFHISEPNSESTSPPRRHTMPPIEAVLAHGFRNINLNRPTEPPITPRSHAFDPWTDLLLGHRVLTPTPAFLLSLSAFRSDDSEDSYWKSSLPVIISYHLVNPATLVDETPARKSDVLPPRTQGVYLLRHENWKTSPRQSLSAQPQVRGPRDKHGDPHDQNGPTSHHPQEALRAQGSTRTIHRLVDPVPEHPCSSSRGHPYPPPPLHRSGPTATLHNDRLSHPFVQGEGVRCK